MGDSYFEYLLKGYLQSGNTDMHKLTVWKAAMNEMREALIRKSPDGWTYVAREATRHGKRWTASPVMDHLACFVAGMLIIASRFVGASLADDWWLPVGTEIT